ncbi:MAG TPA: hypothetical protein VK116_14405, partial [Planctomycetota bacterium]|nr:hypothetical protein [Planctomycetota bacterium]
LCKEADAIREAYEEWIGERDELLSTLKGYKDDLVPAEAAELAARIAKDVASAAVKQLENTVSALQSQVDSATSAANAWKLLLEVVDNRRRDLEANLRAIELHAASEGKIEAFLSPFPGVTLEGAGIGASVSGKHEIALRLELTSDVSIERIVLSVESKGEVKAKAALGVGLEGTAAVKLGAKVGFVPTNGWFELESRSAALGLDVSVVAVAGIGVTLQHGAGRELSVGLDLAQLDDVAPALWELVTEGDVENLATVLIGIDATFSAQDRWIGAAVAKAGGSYVGYGAKLGGAAVWEDRGQKVEETLSAGEVVTQLFQEEAVRDALELLGEAVTR